MLQAPTEKLYKHTFILYFSAPPERNLLAIQTDKLINLSHLSGTSTHTHTRYTIFNVKNRYKAEQFA